MKINITSYIAKNIIITRLLEILIVASLFAHVKNLHFSLAYDRSHGATRPPRERTRVSETVWRAERERGGVRGVCFGRAQRRVLSISTSSWIFFV